MTDLATCPACDGRGGSTGIGCGPAGCGVMTLTCVVCSGSGQVPAARAAEIATWRPRGQAMRDRRVNGEPYRSLRQEADRLGISVVALSEMERGLREPLDRGEG